MSLSGLSSLTGLSSLINVAVAIIDPSTISNLLSRWRGDNNVLTGGSREFNGTDEFFSIADNADLSVGDEDFSIAVWVWLNDTADNGIVAKRDTNLTREYNLIYFSGVSRFRFDVSNDGVAVGTADANNLGAASANTWYFIVVWHDSTADTVNISVDDGTADSDTHTTGCNDGGSNFVLGDLPSNSGWELNGKLALVGFWKKVLSSAERTTLYNAGKGLSRSQLNTSLNTSLISYWNLNEASGNAIDSAGSNDLTDNNTVTASSGPASEVAFDSSSNNHHGDMRSFDTAEASYTTETADNTAFDTSTADSEGDNNGRLVGYDYLTAWDKSGQGNHGTLTGFDDGFAPRVTSVAQGASGEALLLNGTDEYVRCGSAAATSYPYTMSAWIKTTGTSDCVVWNGDKDVATTYDALIVDSNGNAGAESNLTTAATATSSTTVNDGKWHHLVAVFTSNTSRDIWVDAVEEASNTTSKAMVNWDRTSIGVYDDSTQSGFFAGTVDDVRIYNTALTAKEVKYLYESHTGTASEPLNDPGTSNLVLHIDFEDDPRTSQFTPIHKVADDSSNSNDATLINYSFPVPITEYGPGLIKDETGNGRVGQPLGFTADDPRNTKVPKLTGDSSGNENHGELVGFDDVDDPTVPVVGGASGRATNFDGTDDNVEIDGLATQLSGDTAGSWSFWMKFPANPSSAEYLLALGDTNANEFISVWLHTDGTLHAGVTDAGTAQWAFDTDTALTAGIWNQVAIVQNGTKPVAYVNGSSAAVTYTTTTDNTAWVADTTGLDNGRIGCNNVNSGGDANFFAGAIEEVRVYDDALTANEVTYLYKNHIGLSGGTDPGTTNLVGHWPLNPGSSKSYQFDGTDDYIELFEQPVDYINGDFTVTAWVYKEDKGGTADDDRIISLTENAGADGIQLTYDNTAQDYAFQLRRGGSDTIAGLTYGSFTQNTWEHVAYTVSGTTGTFYLNGASVATDGSTTVATGTTNGFRLGARPDGAAGMFFKGYMTDVRFYNTALTADNISYVYNNHRGASGGTDPGTANLVTHLSMNTVGSAGSLEFDGTDQYGLTTGAQADLARDADEPWAYCCWTYIRNAGNFNLAQVRQGINGSGYYSAGLTGGAIQADFLSGGFWRVKTDSAYPLNTWFHFAVVHDGTGEDGVTFYKNGSAFASTVTFSGSPSNPAWADARLTIGAKESATLNSPTDPLDGYISDLRIYHEALTADNVKSVMLDGLGLTGGTSPGTTNLVGQWAMNTRTTSGTGMLFDGSADNIEVDNLASGLAGDTAGSWSLWAHFESNPSGNEYLVAFGDTNANEFIAMWIDSSGLLHCGLTDAGTAQWAFDTDAALTAGETHHIVLVQDGVKPVLYVNGSSRAVTFTTTTDNTMWFTDTAGIDNGRVGCNNVNSGGDANFFVGAVDDVRIFDDALSAAEVTYLYKSHFGLNGGTDPTNTNLISHYKFDETNEFNLTTIRDGLALEFDGSSEYIRIPDHADFDHGTSAFTVCFWAKWETASGDRSLVVKDDSTQAGNGYYIYIKNATPGQITYYGGADNDFGSGLNDNQWRHYAFVRNNTAANGVFAYINGVKVGECTDSRTLSNAFDVSIGATSNTTAVEFFGGFLDEVRIYSVAKTAAEVYAIAHGTDDTTSEVLNMKFDDGPQATTLDGDTVAAWKTNTAPTYHLFEQGTASKKPIFRTGANGINQQEAIEFDGTNDLLVHSSAIANPFHIVLVIKTGSTAFSADHTLFAITDTASTNKLFIIGIDSAGKVFVEYNAAGTADRVNGDTVLSTSTTYGIEFKVESNLWVLEVNGTKQTLTTTSGSNKGLVNPPDADVTTIGGLKTTSESEFFEGLISEVIIYDADVSADDETNLKNYVDDRYGVNA